MTLKQSLLLRVGLYEIQSQGCSVGCVAIGTVTKKTSAFRSVGKTSVNREIDVKTSHFMTSAIFSIRKNRSTTVLHVNENFSE